MLTRTPSIPPLSLVFPPSPLNERTVKNAAPLSCSTLAAIHNVL